VIDGCFERSSPSAGVFPAISGHLDRHKQIAVGHLHNQIRFKRRHAQVFPFDELHSDATNKKRQPISNGRYYPVAKTRRFSPKPLHELFALTERSYANDKRYFTLYFIFEIFIGNKYSAGRVLAGSIVDREEVIGAEYPDTYLLGERLHPLHPGRIRIDYPALRADNSFELFYNLRLRIVI